MRGRILLLATSCFLFSASVAPATDYPPQDHAGGNLTLATGDRIWGLHTNVGTFSIAAANTADVRDYSPTVSDTGWVEVRAEDFNIAGTFDGTASGYTGGAGGGGGTSGPFIASVAGAAPYGTYTQARNGRVDSTDGPPGSGGFGDGTYGGLGGAKYHTNQSGTTYNPTRGGYAALGVNGDSSTDHTTQIGSGGGGGAGGPGNTSNTFGGGGGAGGRGGAAIRLIASNSFTLATTGSILADGSVGGAGVNATASGAGNGGSASTTGTGLVGSPHSTAQAAQNGMGGAGGGILIDVSSAFTVSLPGGTVRTISYDAAASPTTQTTNGGTIKYFTNSGSPTFASVTHNEGRFYTATGSPPTVTSITRTSPATTGSQVIEFTVTFSEDVTGVDEGDFDTITTGGITGDFVALVEQDGPDVYNVSVNAGTGDGTVRLDLADDNSIRDGDSVALAGASSSDGSFTTGDVVTILRVPGDTNDNGALSGTEFNTVILYFRGLLP